MLHVPEEILIHGHIVAVLADETFDEAPAHDRAAARARSTRALHAWVIRGLALVPLLLPIARRAGSARWMR